jgi:hypothetical protein
MGGRPVYVYAIRIRASARINSEQFARSTRWQGTSRREKSELSRAEQSSKAAEQQPDIAGPIVDGCQLVRFLANAACSRALEGGEAGLSDNPNAFCRATTYNSLHLFTSSEFRTRCLPGQRETVESNSHSSRLSSSLLVHFRPSFHSVGRSFSPLSLVD